MNEQLVFDWIPFYEELANRLLEYETRQAELVDFLEHLRVRGYNITSLKDKDESGRTLLLRELDPFTFFGTFNRGPWTTARLNILDAIKTRFSVLAPLPSNLVGVPTLHPLNSRFFAYKARRNAGDIGRLWTVFSRALRVDALTDPGFAVAFDRAVEVAYTNVNLTIGLFWIRPMRYLSLDANMRHYLHADLPRKGLTFSFYKTTLERVRRETDEEIPRLSYLAYLARAITREDAAHAISHSLRSEVREADSAVHYVTTADAGVPVSSRRVVNLSLYDQKEVLSTDLPLQTDAEYEIHIWVGGYHPESIVRNPATFPDELLKAAIGNTDISLRVVLSSRDFMVSIDEQQLQLPPSGRSEVLSFRVRSPATARTARLRAVLYYECNALQSLLITAKVTNGNIRREPSALTAEVEYCLCGTLHEIEMYPTRSLNVLTNESVDGTHTFSVVGTDFHTNFTFSEGKIPAPTPKRR